MRFPIEAINHVCLVVRDVGVAQRFYAEMLGLERHHAKPTWFVLNETSTLHLVPMPEAAAADSVYREAQHFALQVPDLRTVLRLLLDGDQQVFQIDFDWNKRWVTSPNDTLEFGTGSMFVYDPDGNLIEFLQLGHGIFTPELQPRRPSVRVEG
jgi:catechol 2,3-dioxygenase-like lactoylglutathione lyase family enzyme